MIDNKGLILKYSVFLLLFTLVATALSYSADINMQASQALKEWNGRDVSSLVREIKRIAPNQGVIETIRAVDKSSYAKDDIIKERIATYQKGVKKTLIDVRRSYLRSYFDSHKARARRSLYGFGDIGSWATEGEIGAAADFDWSLFGVDKDITKEFADGYRAELAQKLGMSGRAELAQKLGMSGSVDLDKELAKELAKEFDIVVTPEGHEEASGVYGNKGSKDWASRNFKEFSLLTPDGKIVKYTGETTVSGKTYINGDVIAERANARKMAELRYTMSQEEKFGKAYDQLFDSRGNLHLENRDKLNPEAKKALEQVLEQIDMFKASGETASGGIIEMAAHLQHEVLANKDTMTPEALLDKINKYATRGETLKHLGGLPQEAIDADLVLGKHGDPALKEAYDFILTNKGLRKGKLVEAYGDNLNHAEISRLGQNVEKVLKRLAVIQFQHQVEAVFSMKGREARAKKIATLRKSFEANLPRELYPDFHEKVFETLNRVEKTSNNEPLVEAVRQAILAQKKLLGLENTKAGAFRRFNDFLRKTAAGQKIESLKQNITDFKVKYGLDPSETPTLEFVDEVSKKPRPVGMSIVHYLGTAALFVGGVEAIEHANTDAEMSIALGKVWASSTFYGLIASATYAGVMKGHPEELAKVIMFLLIPEASIPDLMKSLGMFAGNVTKKLLFDDQLEAYYALSSFYNSKNCNLPLKIDGQSVDALVKDLYELEGSDTLIGESNKDALKKTTGEHEVSWLKAKVVAKSLRNLKNYGEPAIFPTYGPLVQVTMTIKKLNEEIAEIAQSFSVGDIPKAEGYEWLKGQSMPKGVKNALSKLMTARDDERKKIQPALAQAITSSFQERCRAERELDKGAVKAQKLLDEVHRIFDKLNITEPCRKALEEAGTYNTAKRIVLSDKSKQLKAMKATLKFKDAYSYILNIREVLKEKFRAATGQYPMPTPLDGWPVLVCNPERDAAHARTMLQSLLGSAKEERSRLEFLKQDSVHQKDAVLKTSCEKDAYRKMLEGKYRQKHYELLRNNYQWLQDNKLYWFEIFDDNVLQEKISSTYEKADKARALYSDGLENFKVHCLKKENQASAEKKSEQVAVSNESGPDISSTPSSKTDAVRQKAEDQQKAQKLLQKSRKLWNDGKLQQAIATVTQAQKIAEKDEKIAKTLKAMQRQKKKLDTKLKQVEDLLNKGNLKKSADVLQEAAVISTNYPRYKELLQRLNAAKKSVSNNQAASENGVEAGKESGTVADRTKTPVKEVDKKAMGVNTSNRGSVPPEETNPNKESVEVADKSSGLTNADNSPPPCSYTYSEWSTCDKKTKTQTRTVIAKEPAKCVEDGKPELTQECTPPLTAAEKKTNYFKCLCGYAVGQTCGGTSSYYNTGDSCGGARPCACWAGSSSCRPVAMPTSSEIVKSCYSSAYEVKDPSKKELGNISHITKEENKKYTKPLKVTMNYDKCPIHVQFGETLDFSVNPADGLPPYKVSWSGEGVSSGNTFSFIKTTKPGTFLISSTVTDGDGNSATANCQVIVDAIRVEIVKTSPQENILPVGSKASFKAIVTSGKNSAKGELKYLWEPHPDVQFGDDENPQFETNTPSTTATYKTIATYNMWVKVLKKEGDTYETIGTSNQIPIKIIAPDLKLSVDNTTPYVGEGVTIKVQESPKMSDDMISFWWEIKGGKTINAGPEANIPNNRAYSFIPKSKEKVTVTVHAKAKNGGADLGEKSIQIAAKGYVVNISKPKRLDKAPWKWDPIKGTAVELPQAIAVFQNAEVYCTITPKPKEKVRYQWTVRPKGCVISAPGSKSTNLNAHEKGTYQIFVKVEDKNGIELGNGTGTFRVTVSQGDLDVARQKAEDQQKAQKLLQESRQLWKEGKLQQAIDKGTQAQTLARKDKTIDKTLISMQRQKKELDTKLRQVGDLLDKGKIEKGASVLQAAAVISTNYPRYKELLQRLNAAKKRAGEVKNQNQRADQLRNKAITSWQNGELDKAVEHMQKASQAAPDNAEIAKALKAMQHQKKAIDEALAISDQLIRQGKFKEAKSALKKAEFINTKYPRCTKTAGKLALSEKRAAAEKALAQEKLRQKEEQKKARVEQLIADARRLEESRDLKAAVEKYRQVQQLEPTAEVAARISEIEQKLNAQPASKQNVSATLSEPLNQSASEKNQTKGASTSQTSSQNSKEKAETPTAKNSTGNTSGGYWQLVEEKGSIGRECSPKEVYNDYYRDTVSGFGGHVVITKMIREGNQVYCKLEGQWQRPPEKLYPGRTINLPVTLHRLADSGKYSCDMAVAFDLWDMECGSSGSGGDIGDVELDRKGPKSLSKEIPWKVNEPFHKKAGEKLTIRACYSGANICGKNQGMKYYYQWMPGGSAEKTSLVAEENAAVGRKTTKISGRPLDTKMAAGKTITSTSYTPNNKGDVFKGGHWAGASGGSDWLEIDFTTPQMVTGVYIGEASTDITTNGFKLVLKLKKPDGKWATIDELHDTNINRTALSGGAVGKSIPPYTKKMSQAIKATAFRLEFYGHGWFDATDILIYTDKTSRGKESEAIKKAEREQLAAGNKGDVPKIGQPIPGMETNTTSKGPLPADKGLRRSQGNRISIENGQDSLRIPSSIFEPGEKIAVSFTASPNYPEKSWIGMFKADLPHNGMAKNNKHELSYQYLKKKQRGTFSFTSPIKEGAYDFRMFDHSSGKEVATIKFSVVVDKDAARILLPKTVFEPEEKIKLKFTASPNYPEKSWIGMFKADLPHNGMAKNNKHELAYQYLKKSPNGVFTFTSPTAEGVYDFRMFEHNNGKEVATIKFSVAVDKDAASLTLPKKVFEPGEKIAVSFTASSNYPGKSWIGMFKADLPHNGMAKNNKHELAYQYLEKKQKSTFTFTSPEKEGAYDFRMFEHSNGKEVATIKFTVSAVNGTQVSSKKLRVSEPKSAVEDGVSTAGSSGSSPSSSGRWVLYKKTLIDGCSFYDSECYPLKSCSAKEGSYQVAVGYSTCGCDTCGGGHGSGTYTVPPAVLSPGETITLSVSATGDGYSSEYACFYNTSKGLTFTDKGSASIGPDWCKDIAKSSRPNLLSGEFTIQNGLNKGGVLLIQGGGSIGNAQTSMYYYYLYRWQEQ